MLNQEQLKMEHEHLHYLVEKLQDKRYLNLGETLKLNELKKKKLKIKDMLYRI